MCKAQPDNVLLNDKCKSENPKHKVIPETSYALTHVQSSTILSKRRNEGNMDIIK